MTGGGKGVRAMRGAGTRIAGGLILVIILGAALLVSANPPGAGGWALSSAAVAWAQTGVPAAAPARKGRRKPPAPVIPIADTAAATKLYAAQNYPAAVEKAKEALTKNEKYTPAMLVMARAYYKLGKHEWVRHLSKMLEATNASEAEKGEMYHLLAWMEIEKDNVSASIDLLKKATQASPQSPVFWNNLGGQYLKAKNYAEAAPALERAVELHPNFSKAYCNLGSAYRGLKEYAKAEAAYKKALQLFPTYADAIFHLGILHLDADKMANMDTIAKLNTSISYLQRYRRLMGNRLLPTDPVDAYMAQARDDIEKEQRRIEREKRQQEREQRRAAQKTAEPAPDKAAPTAPAKGKAPPSSEAPLPPSQ